MRNLRSLVLSHKSAVAVGGVVDRVGLGAACGLGGAAVAGTWGFGVGPAVSSRGGGCVLSTEALAPGDGTRQPEEGEGADTEGNDGVTFFRVDGIEHEQRQESGPHPQDRDAAAVTVAEPHQPVMNMVFVGDGDTAA